MRDIGLCVLRMGGCWGFEVLWFLFDGRYTRSTPTMEVDVAAESQNTDWLTQLPNVPPKIHQLPGARSPPTKIIERESNSASVARESALSFGTGCTCIASG